MLQVQAVVAIVRIGKLSKILQQGLVGILGFLESVTFVSVCLVLALVLSVVTLRYFSLFASVFIICLVDVFQNAFGTFVVLSFFDQRFA